VCVCVCVCNIYKHIIYAYTYIIYCIYNIIYDHIIYVYIYFIYIIYIYIYIGGGRAGGQAGVKAVKREPMIREVLPN
jgi:hypothetical protein